LDEDIIEHAFEHAQSGGVEYAEVRAHREHREEIILRNGVLEAYARAVDSGFGVRVLAEGGIGFSSSNRWTMEEAEMVAETALRAAKASRRKTKIVFSEMEGNVAHWGVEEKEKVLDVNPESKIALLTGFDKEVASHGVEVPSRLIQCYVGLTDKHIVNSEGSRITSYVPRVACFNIFTVKGARRPSRRCASSATAGAGRPSTSGISPRR